MMPIDNWNLLLLEHEEKINEISLPTTTKHNYKGEGLRDSRMLHATMNHSDKRRDIPDTRDKPESKRNSAEHGGERYEGLWENDTSRKNKLKPINQLNKNNTLTR